jgi:murein DD-endopeptidase MepM/ murein hydrolase activator NlpD
MTGRTAGAGAPRAAPLFAQRRIEIEAGALSFAIALPRPRPLLAVFVLFACVAAACCLAISDLAYREEFHAHRAETLKTQTANAELRADAARLRRQLEETTRLLAQAEAQIAARENAAKTLRAGLSAAEQQLRRSPAPPQTTPAAQSEAEQIARLNEALVAAERQQQAAAAQRAALASRLAAVQADLERRQAQAGTLKLALDRSTAKLGALGRQAAVAPAIARKLVAAGIDAERIFASFGIKRGVGGPFIPARDAPNPAQLAVQQAAVTTMLKTLPSATPLLRYRVTSPFGIRHNPFTDRGWEFHPGIDLAAPYGTPVYATAPGIVTYAGWMRGYGKLVRIDHGHGLSTGYGHLHAFTVVVGEKVAAGTQIGYEGSTGRSTGPHLIYEVRLNGEPVNPAPFLALGHDIVPNAGAVIPVASR